MSFGFSIGDFIAVGDKAWGVYRKCKDAPDQYKQLARHLEVLCYVLDETRIFLGEGDVPNSEGKTASLAAAGHTCKTSLAEVEEFLEKHSKIGNKGKRLIDTIKFVSNDIQGLRSRLEISTQLLQLSLISLSSVSIAQIKTNLKDIVKEYQSGAHQPTVLSSIIQNRDYSHADDDELYDQLVSDLEARDVHPDCIALHDDYVRNWLRDITLDGILDEATPDSRDEVPHTSSLAASISSTSTRIMGAPHACMAELPGGESIDSPDFASRNGSLSAHPWEGHSLAPPDQPDSDYVQQILGSLFAADPYLPYDPDVALTRIQRAYQRLDYTQRGYLTRSEVLKASHEALEYVGIIAEKLDGLNLPVVISAFDTNQDGQYDESKFASVTHSVVQLAFEAKREQLAEMLSQYGDEARAFLRQQRKTQITPDPDCQGNGRLHLSSQKYVPPFGWVQNQAGSALCFHDQISQKDWQCLPDMPDGAFSVMAIDAAWSVERIDSLQAKWLPTVPQALRSTFLGDFNAVRSAALKYTEFEKSGRPFELSDLDDFAASYHIIQKLRPDMLPHHLIGVASDLEKVRLYSYKILGNILAFVYLLDKALMFDPIVQRFSGFSSAWRKSQASVASRLILEMSEEWRAAVQSTFACRRVDIRPLHNQALALAQDYARHRFAEIELEGSLQEISISGFTSQKRSWIPATLYVRAKLSIDDPPQVIETHLCSLDTSRKKYSWKPRKNYPGTTRPMYEWTPGQKTNLHGRSTIKLQIFYGSLDGVGKEGKKPEWEMVFQAAEKLDLHQLKSGETRINLQFAETHTAELAWHFTGQVEFRRAAEFSILTEIANLSWG